MKRSIVVGLTASIMLLGMIAVAGPAFALHKTQLHQFDPKTIPEKGTQYVLTISGTAKSLKKDLGPFKADAKQPTFRPTVIPIEGKVLLRVDERMSLNPTVVRFIVESGYVETDNKIRAIDSGVALYNNRFTLNISGTDLTLDVKGTLSGGIPDADSVSNISNARSNLVVNGEKLVFNAGISVTKFT